MRINKVKSKNAVSFYIIRSVRRDGKNSSEIVEKLGTEKYIKTTYGVDDADAWARQKLDELNKQEAAKVNRVLIPFATTSKISKDQQRCFNVGYLFLQKIYYQLGIPSICNKIKKEHSIEYDLNAILSRLIYGRILYPSSKLSCMEQSHKLVEQPEFELHQVYRSLSLLADNSDFIQAQLYKNSKKVIQRSTGVLFYDCTNFFFELEQESGLKQYGLSKEHRPNPIVQMGLFMDQSGIPLAFCINKGNQNEQLSLKPLELKILKDFNLAKFIVCTDAGLSSDINKRFNNYGERSFITTQSLKKLEKSIQDWALNPSGWSLEGSNKLFNISNLEDTPENRKKIFYKQKYVEGWDEERDIAFDQTIIVTFSLKYKLYQSNIRNNQVQRAEKILQKKAGTVDRHSLTDAKRFIKKTSVTVEGEIAKKKVYEIDYDKIAEEEKFDGFYAVCTNLDSDPSDIIKINKDRWEIEESFRIMKTDFRARPVYLQRDDRIEAHFLTCFIALMIYRILEKKLDSKYTCEEIIKTLREMDMTKLGTNGYTPSYTRTLLTDSLHDYAGFRTDYELITPKTMAGICRRTKGL